MSNQQFTSQADPDYYVVGGTLKASERCYVPRTADEELLESLKKGDYCYILTTRQMGKSSLVIRTAKKLKKFNICSAYIDLTAIGKDVALESWYLGQIKRIIKAVCKDFKYMDWWKENASFSEVDRYVTFLSEVLLQQISSPVIIFIDEIEYTLNLPYTDDFFAAIRSLYNQRANEPELNKLTFVLLGVASPSDLIKAVDRTPFNIGKRIELNDFTWEEALPLAAGLAPDTEIACKLLERIIYWTGGHPYITQKACSELAKWVQNNWNSFQPENIVNEIVDKIVQQTFLTEHGKNKDYNLHFVRERFLRSSKSAELLNLYKLILQGEEIFDDERNPIRTELKLIGVVKVDAFRKLQVRNRIYYKIFDLSWIKFNSREEEVVKIGDIADRDLNVLQVTGDFISVRVFDNHHVSHPITQNEYRYRRALLGKVRYFWIEGLLRKSLDNSIKIELGLEERIGAVETPFESSLKYRGQLRITSVSVTTAIDVWDNIGARRTLLILGEPGSGKTVNLLELCRNLIIRSSENLSLPIPVVFNLSSWSRKKQTIATWIVEELYDIYNVPRSFGKTLVQKEQLVLLLDGLDEVVARYRNDCIRALNQFLHTYGTTEMVVCSRIEEYEIQRERLHFMSAIYIQPLSLIQVSDFFENAGHSLAGLKTLLQRDSNLQQLARTPLILSIMIIAYQEWSAEELLQEFRSPKNGYQIFFDAYIKRVFQRRTTDVKYPTKKTIHWLAWLARRMIQESQTVFLIEEMQPTLLQNKSQRLIYSFGFGLTGGLVFGLMGGIVFGMTSGLFLGVGGGLSFALCLGTVGRKEIILVEKIYPLDFLVNILISLLTFLLTFTYSTAGIWIVPLLLGLLLSKLIFRVKIYSRDAVIAARYIIPNQGILRTLKTAVISGLIIGLIIGLIGLLIGGLGGGLIGLIVGILSGLLNNSGIACIQHFWLRIILWSGGYIPWNYARFLNYATERILLQKIGGSYIFIHRLLLEHFAMMEIKSH